MDETKTRIIQEFVPGKQVTIAHVIANPDESLYGKLGLRGEIRGAVGVLTITPAEAAIIAADVATKASSVTVGYIDRFSGSLLLVGTLANVDAVVDTLRDVLGFTPSAVTRS